MMLNETLEKLKYKPCGDEDAVNQVYIAGWNDAIETVRASGKWYSTNDIIEQLRRVPWLFAHPTELRLIEVWFQEEAKKEAGDGVHHL